MDLRRTFVDGLKRRSSKKSDNGGKKGSTEWTKKARANSGLQKGKKKPKGGRLAGGEARPEKRVGGRRSQREGKNTQKG